MAGSWLLGALAIQVADITPIDFLDDERDGLDKCKYEKRKGGYSCCEQETVGEGIHRYHLITKLRIETSRDASANQTAIHGSLPIRKLTGVSKYLIRPISTAS